MNVTELLRAQAEDAYRATDGLMALVEDDTLEWRPVGADEKTAWMSTGQLLFHLTEACGQIAEAFVTGDWSGFMPPEGTEPAEGAPTVMRSVESVAQARELLAADRALLERVIDEVGEERLTTQMIAAPWLPAERPLGMQFTDCVQHLASHKSQLFYYLKLRGLPVHTGTLWGLEM